MALNSPAGFHQGIIEGRNWWAHEIHSNMISIINAFDLIRTNNRPGHFFKRLFSLPGTSGNPSVPPLPHPLMIFSVVQSTVCLQLLLDASTSAASALLCSLWRAELPAWHPVCLNTVCEHWTDLRILPSLHWLAALLSDLPDKHLPCKTKTNWLFFMKSFSWLLI